MLAATPPVLLQPELLSEGSHRADRSRYGNTHTDLGMKAEVDRGVVGAERPTDAEERQV